MCLSLLAAASGFFLTSIYIFSQFYNAQFENPANFGAGLRQVVTMMRDPDLPVRIQAALSLKYLIMAKSAKDELRPVIPQILEGMLWL